jgi:hypothetical protein
MALTCSTPDELLVQFLMVMDAPTQVFVVGPKYVFDNMCSANTLNPKPLPILLFGSESWALS